MSLLEDAGSCATSCDVPDYGADCRPCMDDDRPAVEPWVGPLTTGGVFFDGETVYGQPFSCSALSISESPASGVTLVGTLGDAQVVLACD